MLSYNPFYNPNKNTAYKNPGIQNIWDSHKINADKTEVHWTEIQWGKW